jgi:membrane protein required for colicin V production
MQAMPNILDIALTVVTAFFLIRALMRGFIREVMGLAGVVVAILVSAASYRPLGDFLQHISGVEGDFWHAVAFGLVLAVIFGIFVYLGRGLARLIHAGPFSALDRLLGGMVGLAKGILICYLLLNIMLLMTPFAVPKSLKESYLAPHVIRSGRYIVDLVPDDLTRALQERGGLIEKYNPDTPPKRKGQK